MPVTLFRWQNDESQQQEDLADHCRQIDPVCHMDIMGEVVRIRPVFEWTGKATGEVCVESAAEAASLEAGCVREVV